MSGECICGYRPPDDPSPDCERCRLITDLAAARADADRLRVAARGVAAQYRHGGAYIDELAHDLAVAIDATPATGQGATQSGTVAMVEQTRQALADIEQYGRGGVQVLIEPDLARQFVAEQGDLP